MPERTYSIRLQYQDDGRNISVELPGSISAPELLENFTSFMLAVGYCPETVRDCVLDLSQLDHRELKVGLTTVD